jgi:hypothetical protein
MDAAIVITSGLEAVEAPRFGNDSTERCRFCVRGGDFDPWVYDLMNRKNRKNRIQRGVGWIMIFEPEKIAGEDTT